MQVGGYAGPDGEVIIHGSLTIEEENSTDIATCTFEFNSFKTGEFSVSWSESGPAPLQISGPTPPANPVNYSITVADAGRD